MEIWKNIDGFKYYQVSNYGNVRSLDKKVKHNYGGTAIKKGKILKQENINGYLRVVLVNNNGIYCKRLVHRLVGEVFIYNPLNKRTINHIDGNKQNNHINNLEWCTYKENENHSRNTGLKDMNKLISKIKKANNKPINIMINNKVYNFKSMTDCANYLNISIQVLRYRINHNKIKIL